MRGESACRTKVGTKVTDAAERKRRLSYAVRRNRCGPKLDDYLEDIARRLDRHSSTLERADLPTTDAVVAALNSAIGEIQAGAARRKLPINLTTTDRTAVETALLSLTAFPRETILFLYRSEAFDCGAIQATAGEIFDHALRLVDLDGDALAAVDGSGQRGIFLELSPERGVAKPEYWLVVWCP